MSINCSTNEQQVDQNKCFNHWPQYPCYDRRTRTCNSPDGVQLFDPVSDVLYGASSLYLSVLNFAEALLMETPARDRPAVDRSIRRTIHDWGPSFVGGPRPIMFSGDPALETAIPIVNIAEQFPGRYTTTQDVVNIVEAVPGHLETATNTIRRYRDRIMGNSPPGVRPPALERRPSEERVGMGRKRKTKRRRRRKKKRRKRTRGKH